MSEHVIACPRRCCALACLAIAACQAGPTTAEPGPPAGLARRYREGERYAYEMTAVNQDRVKTLRYTACASVKVQKDVGGFVEEIEWSKLVADGKEVALPAGAVHQQLSLAPDHRWAPPDMAKTHPALVGPVLDLMTFYVDLWLATKEGKLRKPGDRLVLPSASANSWADGSYVTLGEDAIDFDITLTAVDESARIATVLVRHVPPPEPRIRLPAAWMQQPVADAPNNWVEVQKRGSGGKAFAAAVGKETFDVELRVSLADGRILQASMDNIVDVLERACANAALDDPGEPVRYRIHRQIEIRLRNDAASGR